LSEQSYMPQLRPLSIGETLDAGFRLFRNRFGTLLACALVPTVPMCILLAVVLSSTFPDTFDPNATGTTGPTDEEAATFLVGLLIMSVLFGLAATLAVAACFKVISSAYLGERATVGSSLRVGLKRALPLIGANLVISIALLPFSIFWIFIIPGLIYIWLFVKWSMAYPAVIAERAGPFRSMGRSWALTRNHWWRTFATLFVLFLLAFVIYLAIYVVMSLAVSAIIDSVGMFASMTLVTVVYMIVFAILFPLMASVVTVLYFDLRVRNEGFDLELLARGVGAGTSQFERAPELPGPPSPGPAPSTGGFTAPEGPAATS
jgi:Membrane domain of glycerophosphoryl diester phosphodiesterase